MAPIGTIHIYSKKCFFVLKILLAGIAGFLLLFTIVSSAEAASVPTWVKNNAGWWADGQI